jgi:extracellular factor (EF) 3-hydroxypalmitic acid methyl ester biosynthesis protein
MQTTSNWMTTYLAPVFPETTVLDRVTDELKAGRIARPLDELFDDLMARRAEEPETWPAFARQCLSHELREFMHADPFTWRAFSKPRGYAGDAVMMDYIYGLGEAEEAARTATPLGRNIFAYMGDRPSARAVRFRRALIAAMLDSTAGREDPRVLAIAAGHLREVELSRAVREGKFAEFVAFDQDEASLDVVAREYARFGITPTPGSVRQILSGKVQFGQYDFVYAAGLFDYLNAPVAAALTGRMFEAVCPGGTMLIPNFLTGIRDVGYMEAFMDWHLIYRDHADMYALAAALPADRVAHIDVFNDPDNTIVFLVVTKK